jgi:glyoxylase-like metal-dependent hydrolase (beta-lactamase superfamily II)
MWKRRSVLGLGLAVLPLAAVAREAPALSEIHPGVWLCRTPERGANGLAVVGDRGAALVGAFDSHEAKTFLDQLTRLAPGRPLHLIATHARQDGAAEGLAVARRIGAGVHVHDSLAGLSANDAVVTEPEELDLGGRRLKLFDPGPGRSPHSLVVYETATRTLFGAAVVRGEGVDLVPSSDPASLAVAVLNIAHAFPDAANIVPERGAPRGFGLLVASEQAASLAYLRQSRAA